MVKYETRLWVKLMIVILFAFSIISLFAWEDQRGRVDVFEQTVGLQPGVALTTPYDPLQGYHEECFENTTVEKYEITQPVTTEQFCEPVCHFEIDCQKFALENNIPSENCSRNDNHGCLQICSSFYSQTPEGKTTKPYLTFWNETVCTKTILVRDLD